MEFHIPKASNSPCFQDSFDFTPQDLADIPCPDDICIQAESSPQDDDNELLLPPGTSIDDFPDLPLPPGTSGDEFPELPLPPGTSGDEFPIPLPPKQKPINTSNNFFPSLPPNKALESSNLRHSESENFNILLLDEEGQQKPKIKADELQEDISGKQAEFLECSKASPSKMDSDEENQDSTIAKPKVLGKEQAKKRLMAFSLSKQPSVSVKKQNKAVTPAKNKEKPPNPNKGTNVQEQFRATISAIEEEKKKMFQNMPSYLLLEMSELAKSSHSSMSSSIQLLEKLKNENADLKNKDNSGKDGSISNKSTEGKRKRSFHKSRSRSKEKKPRRSRSKRRSRSRTKTSPGRSRRRSYSRGRGRRSREKTYKSDNKNSRESQSAPKKKDFDDWKSFKAAGLTLEAGESEVPKGRPEESKSRREKHYRRSRSPNDRPDFKPIFSYLNKGCNQMTSLQAKPADPGNSSPVFLEKTVKYTRTKPILCWAENPSRATEFYMSRQMLLENCDETTGSLLLCIIENKKPTSLEETDISDMSSTKTRPWYPREGCLLSTSLKMHIELETNDALALKEAANTYDFTSKEGQVVDKEGSSSDKEDSERAKFSHERKISLVNDSYLSDEEEQNSEMLGGEVKVQFNINRVKVRSRWDSDNEGENSEKDAGIRKQEKRKEIGSKIEVEKMSQAKDTPIDDFDVAPCTETVNEVIGKKKWTPLQNVKPAEVSVLDTSNATAGNLVSEYEEFLKMVSVDSNDDPNNSKEKIILESKPKVDKPKMKKLETPNEEDKKAQNAQLRATDWDQESDHEEKSLNKKMQFTGSGSHDEFLILRKNENADVMLEKNKKKPTKKKIEKPKSDKKKLLKKSSKSKKKKFEDSFSSDDSSSESCDSDSDSDSDDSASSGKKKKKRTSKIKRKSRKSSSSESDSDSENSKTKKKKQVKKRGKKKKSSSSDENDEVQTALLKQLDFKKQLIMKKIEEIDSISDKSGKKKEKDCRGKKREKDSAEETDLEKYIKSGKKKKSDGKVEKDKKKSKYNIKKGKVTGKRKKLKKSKSSSESYSDSESSDEKAKKKKTKKTGKRKRCTSGSSDSEEKSTKVKSKSSSKTSRKTKRAKRNSSSSVSDDSDDSSKERKTNKKEKKEKNGGKLGKLTELSFKENLLLDEPGAKSGELGTIKSDWESKKVWKNPEGKSKKEREEDDWEASSSVEESEQERRARESSWDEEFETREAKPPPAEDSAAIIDRKKTPVLPDKECTVNTSTDMCEANNPLSSETLKTSLSNFSFNENSFCSFSQELSRDFFLADRSYSNSGNISNSENFRATLIEPRPFQSVSKDALIKKPPDSELYSPGYSDSDLSEAEISKSEKPNSDVEGGMKEDVYDPLNCDSEVSAENNEIELSSIPLPHVPDILPPGEVKNSENAGPASSNSEGSVLRDPRRTETDISDSKLPCMTPPVKSSFATSDFTPVVASQSPFAEETNTPTKRQLMSVKGQQKLISKAASVFQDESDEENIEPVSNKEKISENTQSEVSLKEKNIDEFKNKKEEKHTRREEKDHGKKQKKEIWDRSRERSNERDGGRRRRSRSRENRDSTKTHNKKASSPRRRKSRTPEINREKREIRSDSFEIEPLKGAIDSNELAGLVQPIPVLTGLEAPSSDGLWNRSLVTGCEFPHTNDTLIDHAESFDIYPSEESNFRNRNYDKDYADHEKSSGDKSKDQKGKKERRKSRSRSYSPRKKPRSKSPERRKSPRNRSPRRKSVSPKRRDKSPFSPRRRSPKRKSPSRRYKISRSPDKRRKSPSRSPRKRRGSPSRRSRSASPRKYRSPKHRDESPRKKDSPGRIAGPRDRFSPRDDVRYSQTYPDGLQNRIPVIGAASDDIDMELSPSAIRSPFEGPMGFPRHLPDSSVTGSEMYGSFYEGEYADEFGVSSYPEEVGVNNLITVKNHDIEKPNSPERLSLDQRIELELGVQMSNSQAPSDQYQMSNQVCPPFQEINSSHFTNSYNCENTNISNDNFYQNQNVQINTDFNGQYFNGHQQQQPAGYGSFQQYPNSQSSQNSVLQVGNIVEVVPTLQHPPPLPSVPPKTPQIMQVGNVLQVVPSPKATASVPSAHNYGSSDASPLVKTQKATAVVAPSSIVPTPNPEAVLNPLIKAIQLEREKRKKEKEKRKAEREARRKARQLRREAKLMSVNEKLKKSVQNEGLMLGQEVEDEELLESLDVPSPPIPVEIITVSSISALPPAGKGILITAGFMPKPPSEKKEVKFADGVCPGEGTSTSGGEDIASPPPKPKLPKEKRFKKKKTKVKKKVKVQIIRQIIQEDDDDVDDLSPPPPPPGDPPLVFFAKFPFAGEAQFPVYQTQTTATTLTTVQYPAQMFE